MTGGGPAADARLALHLLALAPVQLGGACLRGGGPLRDMLVEEFRALLDPDTPWRRLPPHIDDERLLGGIDVAASLAAGKAVRQTGLLVEAAGGIMAIPMAERAGEALAGRIAQSLDGNHRGPAVILFDDGASEDERPPASLLERVALHCDLTTAKTCEMPRSMPREAIAPEHVGPVDDEGLSALAGTAEALGVDSVRALLFAMAAARTHAAACGRRTVEADDLAAAARLVLGPRATQMPPQPEQAPPADKEAPDNDAREQASDQVEHTLEDIVLDAATSSIPADLLERLASGLMQSRARGGGGGRRTRSRLRGKPLGARPGLPRGGARLALVDTLRAAVPWQPIRRSDPAFADRSTIVVRKEDVRVRRFEERAAAVTIFCVDASGSAAMARLAEAKGAVERLLAQAYVKRTEVALIAFRGAGAEILLPPTRSLTRARRALAALPGGGGTPLASGISNACLLAEAEQAKGRTPFLVFLTDGSANVSRDGTGGRTRAREDADAAAKAIAAAGHSAILIDISPRPRPDAEQLAVSMRARYLPLPLADSGAIERAVLDAQSRIAA
ncbi:Mg-protoporphyrin IX chelatase [Novosphingobium marinum]|uniref:Magnesium chelatase subunit D n=1 Tax=Novosphingobium marinum TaxID=1514948 RepID=A0A7Y9Y0H7_9SPHN|nr:magnesium chelatase subunit D [Novosphingobium marinum]NYH96406.1 magnesium chelatase subunit D [Novosphingobium marinum]GGC34937.1 Mg-protoporphyrin IX chelatase [Novosphingobium marinum]